MSAPNDAGPAIEQAIMDLTRAIIAASRSDDPNAGAVIDSLCASREFAESALRGEGPRSEEER